MNLNLTPVQTTRPESTFPPQNKNQPNNDLYQSYPIPLAAFKSSTLSKSTPASICCLQSVFLTLMGQEGWFQYLTKIFFSISFVSDMTSKRGLRAPQKGNTGTRERVTDLLLMRSLNLTPHLVNLRLI